MRLLPRRTRHQWIIFLLLVCLLGVFLAYKSLSDSEKSPRGSHARHSHHHLKEKTSNDPKMPIHPEILAEAHSNEGGNIDVKFLKPVVDDNMPLHNLRNLENDDDYITEDEKYTRLKALLKELSTRDWKTAKDADEMMILVKSELSDLDIDSKMSCREIDALKPGSSRGGFGSFYGKKNVDPVRQGYDRDFTVKSVGMDTELKIECLKQDYNQDRCSVMGNYRLMKELVFLLVLQSPSIIKLEGFCLRGETIDPRISKKGALILTESSRPLNSDSITHLAWQQKLDISSRLMDLVDYLETSPVGSLGLEKLHLPDFVMVEDHLKLVDLDNFAVGEKSCQKDTDCTIPEMSRKEIPCERGYCKGRNALNNLLWVYRIVLTPLLRSAPGFDLKREVEDFLDKIQTLEVGVVEVKVKLEQWKKTSMGGMMVNDPQHRQQPQQQQRQGNQGYDERNQQGLSPNQYIDRHGILRQKHPDQYLDFNGDLKWKPTPRPPDQPRQQPQQQQQQQQQPQQQHNQPVQQPNQGVVENMRERFPPGHYEYERVPNANYPGIHDFTCHQSRVSWGCVVSVRNLGEAMSLCDQQESCASFVIFSSNPDADAIMTVVLKNSAGGKPDSNFGATLFKKRQSSFQPVGQQGKAGDSVAAQPAAVAVATNKPQADLDPQGCLKRALNLTASARASRERRLMTHLGLKGIDEEEWLTYADFVKVNKYLGPSQMAPKTTTRIRFRFTFEENVLGMKKGEFIHETGPQFYSTGYLITYHLDRILGLYHIPPTVARRLSQTELKKVRGPGDSKWTDDILPKLLNDLSEPSVLSVPVPPVLKPEALSLKLRDTTVTSVEPFSRNQKVHLEYMLLWTLVKQSQPQQGHQGYKGHLIHFESDLAFNNLKTSVIGYFYHCQFPNSVYKTLVCYKCSDVNKMTRICGLGEEVMNRMKNSGVSPDLIQIGNMNAGELTQIMNNGAASILTVVEHCIKNFGRESVLY